MKLRRLFLSAALVLGAGLFPRMNAAPTPKLEYAYFGTGCFWCAQASFELVKGVKTVTCGYAGGTTPDPTYEEVCTGTTGHAEVVQVGFDPAEVTYGQLLTVFWESHDPTTIDRQGPDEGTQYRSIILCTGELQRKIAEQSKIVAQANYSDPIVTEIVPLAKFWPAEAYHQNYFRDHPDQAYCRYEIAPKVRKLKVVLGPLQKGS